MIIFAEYYNERNGQLHPALGSEGIRIMDRRFAHATMHFVARGFARSLRSVGKDYAAYRLMQGPNLRQATPISPIQQLKNEE